MSNNGKGFAQEFPFEVKARALKIVQIGDEVNGSIPVGIRGFLTTLEVKQWQKYIISQGDLTKVPMTEVRIEAATLLLKRTHPNITAELVEQNIESSVLLEMIYEVFVNEQTGWENASVPFETFLESAPIQV